jgi:ABC-type dipeptide/oligopeptide/nickel transport system permease subunit
MMDMRTAVTPPAPRRLVRGTMPRLASQVGRGGAVGIGIAIALLLVAAIGPAFVGNPTRIDVPARLLPPSKGHFMGTDEFGRDILSRVVGGARISLFAGVGAIAVGLGLGTTLGVFAAYRGGVWGVAVMSLVDLLLALPGVLLAIVLAALLSPSLPTAILAVGVVNVPYYARLVWGVTQVVRIQEYVDAARAGGASDLRIVRSHIIPGVAPVVLVQATLGVGTGILAVSGLSFLGLGAQAPTPEWGLMLSQGQRFVLTAPHMGVFPGLAIMLAVLGFNLIGDALRHTLDPLLSHRTRGA